MSGATQTTTQHLYAAAFMDDVESFIEFYWADDLEHAEEQALNAHPDVEGQTLMIACAMAPDEYVRTR